MDRGNREVDERDIQEGHSDLGYSFQVLIASGHSLRDIFTATQPGFPYSGYSAPQFYMFLNRAFLLEKDRLLVSRLSTASLFDSAANKQFLEFIGQMSSEDDDLPKNDRD